MGPRAHRWCSRYHSPPCTCYRVRGMSVPARSFAVHARPALWRPVAGRKAVGHERGRASTSAWLRAVGRTHHHRGRRPTRRRTPLISADISSRAVFPVSSTPSAWSFPTAVDEMAAGTALTTKDHQANSHWVSCTSLGLKIYIFFDSTCETQDQSLSF